MKRIIAIEVEKEIEEYWLLRGVYDDGVQKRVIAEKEFSKPPTYEEVAKFLEKSKATFVSVEHNFRFPDPESELPFE